MKKTFNVVMLPTEKAEGCLLKGINTLQYHPKEFFTQEYLKSSGRTSEHLYITSDDEIKEGDWIYHPLDGKIVLCNKEEYETLQGCSDITKYGYKKIVATTDKYLIINEPITGKDISDGTAQYIKDKDAYYKTIPQIPESFIQAYIKSYNEGKVITEVDLEMQEEWDFDKPLGNSQFATKFTIKTNSDNTVIVHQSKMYSRDEVEKLCELAFNKGWKINQSPITEFQQWIKDNL